jgi:hypothetical protein
MDRGEQVIHLGRQLQSLKKAMSEDDWNGVSASLAEGHAGPIQKIWMEVRANRARLVACEGPHEFISVQGEGPPRFWCSLCKGQVRPLEHAWYQKGLQHGRTDSDAQE